MLAALSARIGEVFAPNAWLVLEQNCLVGLIALVAEPEGREVRVGYGIAEDQRGRGLASAATQALLGIMQAQAGVDAVLAETSVDNPASQQVLRNAGFVEVGKRIDEEDGELICWRTSVS